METKNLSELKDQELLRNKKQISTNTFILATIFGFFVGVAIYAATNKGGFITFIPLILAFIIMEKLKNNSTLGKELKKEIKSRNKT